MIDLIGTPERHVDNFSGSRWNAAFVPIVFSFRRRDFNINSIGNNAGKAMLYPAVPFPSPKIAANQYVYVNAGPYVGSFKVLNVIGLAGSMIGVVIDTPYTANATGYFNSDPERLGHTMELRILRLQGSTWVEHSIKRSQCDPEGIARLDVSKRLRALVSVENTFDYVPVNWADPKAGGRFAVQYREVWQNNLTPAWSTFTLSLQFYYVNAAKQILEKYGTVMGEFTTFFPASQHCDARFLNPRYELSVWPGYPFDLTFIYSEKIASSSVSRNQNNRDLNATMIGSTAVTALDQTQHTAVNRLTLGSIPANAQIVDVWLEANISAPPDDSLYVEIGYVDPGYTVTATRGNETTIPPTE